MSEYLTKEEIRQWRSSIEKCTLEEFAARLGKTIEEEKETNDIADIVKTYSAYDYNAQAEAKIDRIPAETPNIIKINSPSSSTPKEKPKVKKEQIKEIKKTEPVKVKEVVKPVIKNTVKAEEKPVVKKEIKSTKKEPAKKTPVKEVKKHEPVKASGGSNINITFKKSLTAREQMILEHFKQNPGKTVFAQELADILDLKKNYIYKYIKNLREKIIEDILENSEKGGFKFNG